MSMLINKQYDGVYHVLDIANGLSAFVTGTVGIEATVRTFSGNQITLGEPVTANINPIVLDNAPDYIIIKGFNPADETAIDALVASHGCNDTACHNNTNGMNKAHNSGKGKGKHPNFI